MRRVRFGLTLLASIGALVGAGAASGVVTTIRHVHVTQGTQAFGWWDGNPSGIPIVAGNTIPLVSGRSTAVRVVAEFRLAPGEALPQDVTGAISVTIAGQSVVASSSSAAINAPWDPPAVPLPDLNDDDTLNFEFPAGALRLPAGVTSGTAQFTVALLGATGAVLGTSTTSLELRLLPKPEIIPVGIRYTPFSSSGPDASVPVLGVGDAFLNATLPIDDSCQTPSGAPGRCAYRPFGLLPEQPFEDDANGNGTIDGLDPRDSNALLEALLQLRALIVYVLPGSGVAARDVAGAAAAPADDVYLFGWLPEGALSEHGGAALVSGQNVGYGIDRPDFGPVAFAHELVHMHGIVAPPDSSDFHNEPSPERLTPAALGWDVGGRLIGNPPGTDVRRLRSHAFFDVMGDDIGRTVRDGWLGAPNYLRLIEARSQLPLAGSSRTLQGSAKDPTSTVTIIGSVTDFERQADGRLRATRASLRPTFAIPHAPVRPGKRRSADTDLYVEAIYRIGNRLRRVVAPAGARVVLNTHLPPPQRAHGHATLLGPFTATLPIRGRLVLVRVRDHAGNVLAQQRASAGTPKLAVLRPGSRSALGRQIDVRWRVTDPDTRPSLIRYHVSFSPDGGRTFRPVAIDRRGSGIVLDATQLLCTTNGILRVHASDGVNSTTSDVGQLVNRNCRDALRAIDG